MSDTEATSSATIPSGGTPTDRPLTNKEKRQLAVAQKRQAKEQAALRKAGKSTTDDATLTPQKRQHDEHKPDSTAISDGEAGEKEEEEVEVVSHKEQRRRKKQAKLDAATAADDDSPTDPNALMHPTRAATNNNTAALPRSGFSIWVGNLSFFTPPAKLVDWFNQRGIDGISRVNMPKGLRRAEMNKGFCYLDLPSKDMLVAALNLSEQPLDGRKLLIKNGSDFTGRPDINSSALGIAKGLVSATTSLHARRDDDEEEKEEEVKEGEGEGEGERKGKTGLTKTAQRILRAQKNPPSMTLFLGNLSFNTTEQGVRDLFDHSATKRNPPKPKKATKIERKSTRKTIPSSSSSSSSSDSDSDSDSSSSDSDSSSSSTTPTPTQHLPHPSPAGIRKVRLATFQDAPTKCKGFGFLDFHTVEHATASLIDPRNTLLDGRRLILQFASADATRRGASKTMKSAIANRKPNELRVGFQRNKVKRERDEVGEVVVKGRFDPEAPLPKRHKETKEERRARRAAGGGVRRARPGAALANAQRASTGIVQSTGTKVTFDD